MREVLPFQLFDASLSEMILMQHDAWWGNQVMNDEGRRMCCKELPEH